MNKNIIKIVAGFALMLSLVSPAVAVAPVVLSAAELLLPPLLIAGMSFLAPTSSTENVPKTGTADNYGVKRNLLAKIGTYSALGVTAYIAYDELRQKVGVPGSATASDYPKLSTALHKKYISPLVVNLPIDTYISFDSKSFKITGVTPSGFSGCINQLSGYWSGAGHSATPTNQVYVISGPSAPSYLCPGFAYSQATSTRTIYTVQESSPPWQPKPTDEVVSALQSPSLSELYPEFLPEIDKLIQANPSLLPVDSKTLSDISKNFASDTVSAANAKAVNSLKAIRDAKQAAYNANPTSENKEALDKAEADLAAAEAKQAQDELTATKDKEAEAEKLEQEEVDFESPEIPELKSIDLSPLKNIGVALTGKFPFSLLETVSSMASSFVATPVAPTFTISFPSPFNYDWTFSLERWDTWAQLLRFLIGASFLVLITMQILKRWV